MKTTGFLCSPTLLMGRRQGRSHCHSGSEQDNTKLRQVDTRTEGLQKVRLRSSSQHHQAKFKP